jgi:uncharacterized protein YjbI with pentapeptide repeats
MRSDVDLPGAIADNSRFENTNFQGGVFWKSSFRDVTVIASAPKLDSTDLSGACFSLATLSQASLQEANLEGATLENTDLKGANLSWAI